VGIVVCDLTNPTNPTPAATVNGSLPNSTRPLYFWSFQVVGNLLFAADSYTSAVLAFTFDPVNKNFSQLAAYFIPGQGSGSSMAVTPDGALAYVASGYDNAISVLDANALVNGQPALITKLATSIPMQQIAVGPIATLGPVHDQRRPPAAVDHPSSRERRLSRPLMLN
jgi:DNA-binding beta-propeller fold protein YncE